MEPVLINRCRFDADTLRVSTQRTYRKHFVLQLILCAAFLGVGIYELLHYREIFPHLPYLLLVPAFCFLAAGFYLWRTLTAVNKYVKRAIQRLEENRQVRSYDCVFRFPDTEIQMEASISSDLFRLPYASVKRIVPYRNLILVYSRAKQYFTLDQNHFENGAEADFWKLMNEKCPEAVPRAKRS